jgi:CDP-paratose 2-epimerase
MKILISGGCGFVGSQLAKRFQIDGHHVTAFDNLKRRGSELNLAGYKDLGIRFIHGDIRCESDLFDINEQYDLFVEASAEPSVHAGLDGSPNYLLQTNLVGTLNCLEFARKHCGGMIFLSTSRVYSIKPLREIRLCESKTRLEIDEHQTINGISPKGVSLDFPVHQARSLYGATKLASELIVQEYADTYKFPSIINRCGVIAGPGQFGKVDQGVFTMWVANHIYQKPLKYIGFEGTGKQVRDLLHPEDLYNLIAIQSANLSTQSGDIFNVGGGYDCSTSLLEFTHLCQEATAKEVEIGIVPITSPVDIPLYITDNSKVSATFGWKPKKTSKDIVTDINHWISNNIEYLKPIFG